MKRFSVKVLSVTVWTMMVMKFLEPRQIVPTHQTALLQCLSNLVRSQSVRTMLETQTMTLTSVQVFELV